MQYKKTEALKSPYQEIYAANTIRTRYIYEDIPTAMLAFISIGELVGVSVEKMKFVVRLCEEMLDEDLTHRPESRTIESLGLSGMTLDQLLHYATTGVK